MSHVALVEVHVNEGGFARPAALKRARCVPPDFDTKRPTFIDQLEAEVKMFEYIHARPLDGHEPRFVQVIGLLHPSILQANPGWPGCGQTVLCMERTLGTLEDVIGYKTAKKAGRLQVLVPNDSSEAAASTRHHICLELADVFAALLRFGVTHFDIKPANLGLIARAVNHTAFSINHSTGAGPNNRRPRGPHVCAYPLRFARLVLLDLGLATRDLKTKQSRCRRGAGTSAYALGRVHPKRAVWASSKSTHLADGHSLARVLEDILRGVTVSRCAPPRPVTPKSHLTNTRRAQPFPTLSTWLTLNPTCYMSDHMFSHSNAECAFAPRLHTKHCRPLQSHFGHLLSFIKHFESAESLIKVEALITVIKSTPTSAFSPILASKPIPLSTFQFNHTEWIAVAVAVVSPAIGNVNDLAEIIAAYAYQPLALRVSRVDRGKVTQSSSHEGAQVSDMVGSGASAMVPCCACYVQAQSFGPRQDLRATDTLPSVPVIPQNTPLCVLCTSLQYDVKNVLKVSVKNLGGSGGGTQGSLSPKSLAVVLMAMWCLGQGACLQVAPPLADIGHGDGRVLLSALSSGLFNSVIGVDIMTGPECRGILELWAQCKRIETTNRLSTFYGRTVNDLSVTDWHTGLRGSRLCDLHVFSFMQGWKSEHVEAFIDWVLASRPIVVVIAGHASGAAGILSSRRLESTWKRMTRAGYSLRRKLLVSMEAGGVEMACCFVRLAVGVGSLATSTKSQ
jgi:hypothetical protein